jgi:hypothetical protein
MSKESPSLEGNYPSLSGVWILCADVSEHSVCSSFIGGISTELTPPMKMEQKKCSVKSPHKIQIPGNHPKEITQHSEHGEKSSTNLTCWKFHSKSWIKKSRLWYTFVHPIYFRDILILFSTHDKVFHDVHFLPLFVFSATCPTHFIFVVSSIVTVS